MEHLIDVKKKVHIGFSAQLVETCVAKQIGDVKKLTPQGTERVTGKCDEQKMLTESVTQVLCKNIDDPYCSASAHMIKDNKTESSSKLNRSEQKPSAISQPGEHVWSVKVLCKVVG